MAKKSIVLLGGQLFNKGAQAMTFISVDEMKRRFPDHDVVLLSSKDYKRDEHEKENYQFRILPNPRYRLLYIAAFSKKFKLLKYIVRNQEHRKMLEMFHNTDYVLDISGYALGSDWGCENSRNYCLRVKLTKMLGARVYLMPQSFGPFDYTGKKANQTKRAIRSELQMADLIMAREREGYELLKKQFGLCNVIQSYDMVLQNKGIHLESIYKKLPTLMIPDIRKNSVCIIPNTKTMKFSGDKDPIAMYDEIIDSLKKCNKHIYFMAHSAEDRSICKELYDRYQDKHDSIFYLDHDFSCIEFDQTVSKFDFIIASRYHAIIHAYRNAVPAIVLGWALKYKELMRLFTQEQYHFNVRESIDLAQLKNAVQTMTDQYRTESLKIQNGLNVIQKDNSFNRIQ